MGYGTVRKTALHVAVWEHNNGPVPEGYLVHHKDDNPLNNNIDNLELVTPSQHGKMHKNGRHLRQYRDSEKYSHTCQHCGKEYRTFRKNRTKFCSQECGTQHRTELRTCPVCGEEYRTRQRNVAQTCSVQCGVRLRDENRKARTASTGL